MKISKRDAALKAFDCLHFNADKKPLGMALTEIVEELKLNKTDQAGIYFGLKVLVEQGIILYGQNKRGKEKLYTIINGKDAAQADFSNLKEKVYKQKPARADDTEEIAAIKKEPKVFDTETIKAWMKKCACMYASAETLASAAAVKHNVFVYTWDKKFTGESVPAWITQLSKLYIQDGV
jgi:hypothetical protein